MKAHRMEERNHDGTGFEETRIFDMPVKGEHDFWPAVTDVECPMCEDGTVRWAEAGYVPGYRICDKCGRHFLAEKNATAPRLALVRGRMWSDQYCPKPEKVEDR